MDLIAEVIINNSTDALNKEFDYLVPEELKEKVELGQVVSVPFGRGNKLTDGYIVGFKDKSEYDKLKYINMSTAESMVSKNSILLARWMSRQYLCNISECLKLMLPSKIDTLDQKEGLYAKFIISNDEVAKLIDSKKIKGIKQVAVLNHMFLNKSNLVRDILRNCSASISTLRSLEKQEIIEIYEDVIEVNPLKDKKYAKTTEFIPNEYQKEVIDTILADINTYSKYLIHGVTGSGKTEVYLQLIKEVLSQGKQAIVLVPEISLTPQMIERFVGRFGNQVAVLHSRLSDTQKKDQWYKIKEGKVNVVVGARSAVFAPFENLGIIIIDEEHENTYKSEKMPRYNALEVACKRGEIENAEVVLGSATPLVEDYYKAKMGNFKLLNIPIRANKNSKLPKVELVDMRKELSEGNKSIFSNMLFQAIEQNIKEKNQTILFLNKRGYSSFVLCRECGFVAKCTNCNISMNYHSTNNRLVCHYCGYNEPKMEICPRCKSKHIRHFGVGTQKLEEEVRKSFPDASVLRMDMDTTSTKDAHEKILTEFREKNVNILIGTQMIAKGHDFPNVTLVGVISADMMLNVDDFRATEKTFQLLTQVEGRAGRAEKEGKVIVQTYDTEHFSILDAKEQNYKKFYEQEINIREQLMYPPFKDILVIGISSFNYNLVKQTADILYNQIKEKTKDIQEFYISKPTAAPISKINNRFRWRIVMKCNIDDNIREILFSITRKNKVYDSEKCSVSVDINPMSMC